MTNPLARLSSFPWEKGLFYSLLVLFAAFTFSNALVEITYIAALIFSLGQWIFIKRSPFAGLSRGPLVWVLVYTAIAILSFIWSEYPKESSRGILKVLQQVTIFILVSQLPAGAHSWKWFKKIILAVTALAVVNGLYQYFTGTDFIRHFSAVDASAGLRVTSSFKSYSLFAAFLVLLIPPVWMLGWKLPRFSRAQFLLFTLTAASLLCLYFTRSRGAWLGLFAGTFLSLIIYRQWKFIILLAFAGLIALAVMPRHMLIHLDADNREQSIVERLHLWQRAVHVIESKPFTGTGINTYNKAHAKYDTTGSWRVKSYYAHNGYLQMAAEIGLPGLAAFLAFLTAFLYRVWQRSLDISFSEHHFLQGLLAGLLSYLAFAGVDTMFHSPQSVMTFWFFMGLAAAASKNEVTASEKT